MQKQDMASAHFLIIVTLDSMVRGQVVLPPGSMPIVSPSDPCIEIQNITDVVNLPSHKYMVLEHCLYYDLQRTIDQKFQQINAIAMLPPSNGDKQGNISINVHGLTLQNIWLNDMMKDLHIRGFFEISWSDPRITWDSSKWRVSTLKIQTASHIWVPQVSSQKYVSSVANGDFTDYKRLRAKNGGNISAYMNFNLQAFCDVDLENYPSDIHTCCFHLQPKLYTDLINFKVEGVRAAVDKKYYRETGWKLGDVDVTNVFDEEGVAELKFCTKLSRSSTTLRVELTIPMAVCAALILISPVFGAFQGQLHVKLYALLLQYLCLQYLANKTSQIGMGNSTPKIFRFYEFTIAINLLSIICTLLMWVCARQHRKLPPPSSLANLTTIVNRLLCVFNYPDLEVSGGSDSSTNKHYREEWGQAFYAIHSVLMFFVVLVYLIGVSVIYC